MLLQERSRGEVVQEGNRKVEGERARDKARALVVMGTAWRRIMRDER